MTSPLPLHLPLPLPLPSLLPLQAGQESPTLVTDDAYYTVATHVIERLFSLDLSVPLTSEQSNALDELAAERVRIDGGGELPAGPVGDFGAAWLDSMRRERLPAQQQPPPASGEPALAPARGNPDGAGARFAAGGAPGC